MATFDLDHTFCCIGLTLDHTFCCTCLTLDHILCCIVLTLDHTLCGIGLTLDHTLCCIIYRFDYYLWVLIFASRKGAKERRLNEALIFSIIPSSCVSGEETTIKGQRDENSMVIINVYVFPLIALSFYTFVQGAMERTWS